VAAAEFRKAVQSLKRLHIFSSAFKGIDDPVSSGAAGNVTAIVANVACLSGAPANLHRRRLQDVAVT
jgi:hypothetical protein